MSRFSDIADVDFLGGTTLAGLKADALRYYTEALKDITGSSAVTIPDERKAELYAAAQLYYQLLQTANDKGRQNLLKYARGEYLDNLVLSRGMTRKAAEAAVCTIRFTLSAARSFAVAIPAGTRVTTPARDIYFATNEAAEIAAGETYTDVLCTATEGGNAANGLAAGEVNNLVDPIPYIAAAVNTDTTQGGTDEETDDELAERFFNARNEFSTAGSENAYIYHTKAYSTTITDVVVKNPSAAVIEIYILLDSRRSATPGFLTALTAHLSNPDIKPLTDTITAHNVGTVEYSIAASYTIYSENLSRIGEIQAAVAAAVEEYKAWQCERIGRDINPQKLISLMIAAGAATVNITMPATTSVGDTSIAKCIETTLTYSGTIAT